MRCNLLHVDDALKTQPQFLAACRALQAREIDAQMLAQPVRLWGKEAALKQLSAHIASSLHRSGNDTIVTFMGSGDFHHVSALLIGCLTEKNDEPITVIHFDNHPDWVHFSGGAHCGSWVNRALTLPQIEKIITIGVCSRDLVRPQFKRANLRALRDGKIILLPWHSPSKNFRERDVGALEEAEFLGLLTPLITTKNVYITIDKDVLTHADAITNWDQGQMPITALINTLRHILANHHAIGIDVTGDYSTPHYAGRMHEIALKKIEARLDQPRPPIANGNDINQRSNLMLLKCLREAA